MRERERERESIKERALYFMIAIIPNPYLEYL